MCYDSEDCGFAHEMDEDPTGLDGLDDGLFDDFIGPLMRCPDPECDTDMELTGDGELVWCPACGAAVDPRDDTEMEAVLRTDEDDEDLDLDELDFDEDDDAREARAFAGLFDEDEDWGDE